MCLSLELSRPNDVLSRGTHAGFQWITMKNNMGHRCGYVRIPKNHPWHGQDVDVEVHGGITFSDFDVPCKKDAPDDAYWIGFDCGHYGDAPDPSLFDDDSDIMRSVSLKMGIYGKIRDQKYVENECRQLCKQAKEAE